MMEMYMASMPGKLKAQLLLFFAGVLLFGIWMCGAFDKHEHTPLPGITDSNRVDHKNPDYSESCYEQDCQRLWVATKVEWNQAADADKLAAARDFGMIALTERFVSPGVILKHLGGSMANFRSYVVEIRSCIDGVANSSDATIHNDESINFSAQACANRIVNSEIK